MDSIQFKYLKETEPQIFYYYSELNAEERFQFDKQLHEINLPLLKRQKELLLHPEKALKDLNAFDDFSFSGNQENRALGEQLIAEGQVGCLLLAGGQGTRLQFNGPKGTFPISVIKKKSLFQMCAEKVKAASVKAQRLLFLAIMTSKENEAETKEFFQKNDLFGLLPSQLFFFSQCTLPLLDQNGHLFLEKKGKISTGADGNGAAFLQFVQSGIFAHWLKQGIKYIQVILIDNPLADPFDAELVGFHHQKKVEVTLKCTEKEDPYEKVGVVVKQEGHFRVIEYTELSDEEKKERRKNGKLKHCCANLSLFCFSFSFIEKLCSNFPTLDLHRALKKASYIDKEGVLKTPEQPNAWKFETYIFDYLIHTEQVAALIYPRKECFAPLKNYVGPNSPKEVQKALQERDKQVIEEITGLPAPSLPFELPAEFYYPTAELESKWKGKAFP